MLWIKAFHIIFMVTWFAGLFYLPRLFVYHAQTSDPAGHQRFCVMERKLLGIMTVGAMLTAVFGIWLLMISPGLLTTGWLRLKLVLVVLLIAYHIWCTVIVGDFRQQKNQHTETWFRWFNEVPALLLIAVVLLAILKPF